MGTETSDKKILILAMTCNNIFFLNQEKLCRETWAKDVIGRKYKNISYLAYTSSNGKESYIDKKKKYVYCNTKDGLFDTYEKTVECFKVLEREGIEYDYIFRTNTSNVVNVALLNKFVQTLENEEEVWGGEIYSLPTPCPIPNAYYIRGNSMLLSKKAVEIFLDLAKHTRLPKDNKMFADDNMIGNILNTYHIMRFENYHRFVKSYGQGWYMSSHNLRHTNGRCSWMNEDKSREFLRKFISIQIKSYDDRAKENARIKEISDIVLSCKDDDYKDVIEEIHEYAKDPFIMEVKNGKRRYRRMFAKAEKEEKDVK